MAFTRMRSVRNLIRRHLTGRLLRIATDQTGTGLSGWMKPGTYYLKETTAPEGYAASDTVYKVQVVANQVTTAAKAADDDVSLSQIVNVRKAVLH